MTWPTAKLGEVCQIVSGSTPRTGTIEYWNGEIAWATPKDLSDLNSMYIDQTAQRITKSGYDSCSTAMLPVKSVLLSSRAPIGYVAVNTVPMCTNQGFKNLIPNSTLVHSEYLYFWLRANREYLQSIGNGATFKELSKATVERIAIPIPPLVEQKRIAAILDEAEALRRKRREVVEKLDTLLPALFLDMFGDPATNTCTWRTTKIVNAATRFSDGPFGSNLKTSHYTDDGVRVIRLQNIGVGEFLDGNKVYIAKEHYATLARNHCVPGDVLIGTLGDPNLRACLMPETIPHALNKADCILFRTNLNIATPEYICALLNMPSTLSMAQCMILGQTRTRISMGRLKELVVPMPPLDLQKTFTAIVQSIRLTKRIQEETAAKVEALFEALQQQLFPLADAHANYPDKPSQPCLTLDF